MSLEKMDSGCESQLTKVLSGYAEFCDISLLIISSFLLNLMRITQKHRYGEWGYTLNFSCFPQFNSWLSHSFQVQDYSSYTKQPSQPSTPSFRAYTWILLVLHIILNSGVRTLTKYFQEAGESWTGRWCSAAVQMC